MVPRIAIGVTFQGRYNDQCKTRIGGGAFGGSLEKVDSDLRYESVFFEEYHLGELLEKFMLFFEENKNSLDKILVQTDAFFLTCHVYASDTMPSINLSSELMRTILRLHEKVLLDIDIILTAE